MPVEKVDKPEPPPTYYVEATVETKDDRGHRQGESQSDEYSGSHAAPGWQRLYSAASNRRYMKLRREDIIKAWFRGTTMQKGISLAEVDIQTRDGRILRGAQVLLSIREDFWTLKKFQPGQEVPLNMLVKEPVIEISLPAPRVAPSPQEPATINQAPNKIDYKKLFLYIGFGIVLLIIIISLLI